MVRVESAASRRLALIRFDDLLSELDLDQRALVFGRLDVPFEVAHQNPVKTFGSTLDTRVLGQARSRWRLFGNYIPAVFVVLIVFLIASGSLSMGGCSVCVAMRSTNSGERIVLNHCLWWISLKKL